MVSGLSLLSLFPILYKQLDYGYHRVEDPDVIFLMIKRLYQCDLVENNMTNKLSWTCFWTIFRLKEFYLSLLFGLTKLRDIDVCGFYIYVYAISNFLDFQNVISSFDINCEISKGNHTAKRMVLGGLSKNEKRNDD